MGVERTGGGLRVAEVFRDEDVRVVSDTQVTKAQARELANRVERAWDYDAQAQKWRDPEPLDGGLTVAVLSKRGFGALTGDSTGATAGVTTGPDLFAVPVTVLGRRSAQDDNTLAHELAHVQDFREGGARLSQVPIYLQEGKEYVLGERYPLAEGLDNPHLAYVGNALAKLTGKDARWLLQNFRQGRDEQRGGNVPFYGEVTGALFVEFLRVHGGHPDAVRKVADVIARVGDGEAYPAAFERQFGVSPDRAEDAFVEFVSRTEGDPRGRLKGTLFDPARHH